MKRVFSPSPGLRRLREDDVTDELPRHDMSYYCM